jgi:carboxylesterase type B
MHPCCTALTATAIDDLRFARPLPALYNETVVAQAQPPACIQAPQASTNQTGYSEDCLFLNVYKPAGVEPTVNSSEGLPVVVWMSVSTCDRQ